MKSKLLTVFLILGLRVIGFGQDNIWQTLQTVQFSNRYDENIGIDIQVPEFGPWIIALEGKEITVEGYMIPLKGAGKQDYFMFSALPYNMCFFCGKAGPETAMEVYTTKGERIKFREEKIRIKGLLELNKIDFSRPIYKLREAKLEK